MKNNTFSTAQSLDSLVGKRFYELKTLLIAVLSICTFTSILAQEKKSDISNANTSSGKVQKFGVSDVVSAAGTPGTYYAICWTGFGSKSNIFTAYDDTKFSQNRKLSDSEISSMAILAKQVTDPMPAGRKTLHLNCGMGLQQNVLIANVDNYIWFDKGYAILSDNVARFIKKFKAIGGFADHTFVDIESGSQVWNLPGGGMPSEYVLKAISDDPRYITEIRPLMIARGFEPASPVELAKIGENSGEADFKSLHIYNDVAILRAKNYINKYIYDIIKEEFPAITFSTYEAKLENSDFPCPVMSGWTFYNFNATGGYPGTHQSPACYGWIWEGLASQRTPDGSDYYPRTAFNGFRHSVNYALSAALADSTAPLRPWIAFYSYVDDRWGADRTKDKKPWIYAPIGKTDYYQENILHIGLMKPDGYLGWFPSHMASQSDYSLCNELLKELDEVAGYDDRELITTRIWDWSKSYLITGMYAGGRNLWRVTPDLAKTDLATFLKGTNPVTFGIGNSTIVFPAGSAILTPTNNNGPIGYWVTSPTGTAPSENGVPIPIKRGITNVPIESLSLNVSSLTMDGSLKQKLTATVLPITANKIVKWSSSNNAIATVSNNGLVTAVSQGQATITATTSDGIKSATCNIQVLSGTGLNAVSFTSNLVISPNPAKVNSPLLLKFGIPVSGTVQIIDLAGKLIFQSNKVNNKSELKINNPGLIKGVYLVKLNTSNNCSPTSKLMVTD